MDHKPSLEEMWNEIEKFGTDRKSFDPNNEMGYDQVEELYLSMEEKRKTDEQIRLLQVELEKENK
jgi:hypothetical protein